MKFTYVLVGRDNIPRTPITKKEAAAVLRQHQTVQRRERRRVVFHGLLHVRTGKPYDRLEVMPAFTHYDNLFEEIVAVLEDQGMLPRPETTQAMHSVTDYGCGTYDALCAEAVAALEARERERAKVIRRSA